MNKQFKNKIKHKFLRGALYSLLAFYRCVPYTVVQKTGKFLVAIVYRLIKKHRRVAYESLTIAYPDWSHEQKVAMVRRNCRHILRSTLDIGYGTEHAAFVDKNVTMDEESETNLKEALSHGKGVVGVSAHFGNFVVMLFKLGLMKYQPAIILRPSRDPKIDSFFQKKVKPFDLQLIFSMPRRKCVQESFAALKQGKILMTLLDQNYGSKGGVFVDFFGQPAATATGPIVFAMRAQAPMVPMFVVRQEDDTYRIIVKKPYFIEEKEDDAATIWHNTQEVTRIIEETIREYPHEWAWIHKRWKTKQEVAGQKEVGRF